MGLQKSMLKRYPSSELSPLPPSTPSSLLLYLVTVQYFVQFDSPFSSGIHVLLVVSEVAPWYSSTTKKFYLYLYMLHYGLKHHHKPNLYTKLQYNSNVQLSNNLKVARCCCTRSIIDLVVPRGTVYSRTTVYCIWILLKSFCNLLSFFLSNKGEGVII